MAQTFLVVEVAESSFGAIKKKKETLLLLPPPKLEPSFGFGFAPSPPGVRVFSFFSLLFLRVREEGRG